MSTGIRIQLWVMMFLQFFVWGSWAVTLGTYLGTIGFSDPQIGAVYSTAAWGAIVSPFFAGMVADRFFPAQIIMAVMHLIGAGFMYWASTISDPLLLTQPELSTTPALFFWVLLAYSSCYMPTLALVNAISFNQMSDPGKEFPAIRVLGTLGWIAAGLTINMVLPRFFGNGEEGFKIETTNVPLQMAAAVSLALGVYSFFLPKTPPKSQGKKVSVRDILGLDALKLMKDPSFAIFVVSSLLICIPLAFYYNFTNPFLNELGVKNAASIQTFGQVSETLFMVLMPLFFIRLGVKKMLLIGMLAWTVRYVFFAYGSAGMPGMSLLFIGILLHGICYDFFFVTGQIYVDKTAPKAIQANAQGFFALITYGVGMMIGSNVSGWIVGAYAKDGGHDWMKIWLIPGGMALAIVVLFFLFFREKNGNGKAV
ncbi:MAG: nucleoside permease [Candidatus Hydrogenedentes bacterium]|nr:nucleoside permease [Candidatus Hydrogenedentota bacterium]